MTAFATILSLLALAQSFSTSYNITDNYNDYTDSGIITNSQSNPNEMIGDNDFETLVNYEVNYGMGGTGYLRFNKVFYMGGQSDEEIIETFYVGLTGASSVEDFPTTSLFSVALSINEDTTHDVNFEFYASNQMNNYKMNVVFDFRVSAFYTLTNSYDVYYLSDYVLSVPLWADYTGLTNLSTIYNCYQLSSDVVPNSVWTNDLYFVYTITWRYVPMNEMEQYFYNQGSANAYTLGYQNGYEDGYNVGSTGVNTSFTGLLGAIIDTPILFLRKMFGYQVFGVNIYYALATMMSLLVALAIFRLVRAII